jgi:hypothetical protein
MEGQPRCIKCGRILKSAASIARGMGSRCAGSNVTGGKTFPMRIRRGDGKVHQSVSNNTPTCSILTNDSSIQPLRKRADISRMRAERRKLFDERKPFQCGVLSRTHIPAIYVPTTEGTWKEKHTGRIIPHEKLQNYLKRFRTYP